MTCLYKLWHVSINWAITYSSLLTLAHSITRTKRVPSFVKRDINMHIIKTNLRAVFPRKPQRPVIDNTVSDMMYAMQCFFLLHCNVSLLCTSLPSLLLTLSPAMCSIFLSVSWFSNFQSPGIGIEISNDFLLWCELCRVPFFSE